MSQSSDETIKPPPSELGTAKKLNTGKKLAYGMGDFGTAIVTMVRATFLLPFLITTAGIAPATAGFILAIGRVWDGVNDPLIGALSDRTSGRWGRRRPWLLIGAVPLALAYILQFYVPAASDALKIIYYIVVAMILDASYTAVNVPYAALTAEMVDDHQERTSLNMYRFSFSVLGGLLAVILYQVLVNIVYAANPLLGNIIQGVIVAFVVILASVIVFANTEEPRAKTAQEQEHLPIFQGIKIALSSRPFLYVLSIYLFAWLALQFVQSLLVLYFRNWIGGNATQELALLVGLQLSIFVFILFWGFLSRRIGRKRVYFLGVPIWIVVQIGLFFVQPGQILLVTVLGILAGIGVSLAFLVPWSLLPDVVDEDELRTGRRREGIFYGFFVFLQKLGISIGVFVQGVVLQWAGFIESDAGSDVAIVQPDSALMALRVMISLVPIVFLVISLFFVQNNPIDEDELEKIQAELARRRSANAGA